MLILFLLDNVNGVEADGICEYIKNLPAITYYRYIILFINHIDDIIDDAIAKHSKLIQNTLTIRSEYQNLIHLFPTLDNAISIHTNDTEKFTQFELDKIT